MNTDLRIIRGPKIAQLIPVAWLIIKVAMASAAADGAPAAPPWLREMSLREAAQTEVIRGQLDPRDPNPSFIINNPDIKASLWGPAERMTLSMIKTDVYDRRYGRAQWPTLADIQAGAYSPANRDFDDLPPGRRRTMRGYLVEAGGREDPASCWNAYPFPCQKPVGQIILGFDELAGAAPPRVSQRCRDGVVQSQVRQGAASAAVEMVISMTRNVIAVRGQLHGIKEPWLRIYRHRDQAYRLYMTADQSAFLRIVPNAADGVAAGRHRPYDYDQDAAWNGPVDPPQSGSDGRYFWIRQRLPAEKTFPQGFEYVLMGMLKGGSQASIKTVDGAHGLGTPAYGKGNNYRSAEQDYAWIREASGSAATAVLAAESSTELTAYFAVVTVTEAADPLAEARRRLESADRDGFDALVRENSEWWGRLYDQREDGRVFYGAQGSAATENIQYVFRSWYSRHGGVNTTDARRYQASASYAGVEQDLQAWKSLPCYNELFYTPMVVRNRSDALEMWWQLLEHWLPAARRNARETYGMPGMMLVHGYLPPIKADEYVHSFVALEYCLETAAQVVRVPWDQWDYGRDVSFLREKVYPALRDLALFYAAYAKREGDGYYHVVPAIEAENWGFFPEFRRGRDTTSALTMFRWTFRRAAEAAEILGVDADLREKWRELAAAMAPYPLYPTAAGPIFNGVDGTVPGWTAGVDHPWYVGVYPTTLADEINLDSPITVRDQMLRTAYAVPNPSNSEVLVLLGACPQTVASVDPTAAVPIATTAMLRDEIDKHPERLMNSRSGRIHLFPCVPTGATIAFRRLQARGGFLVSAVRRAGEVFYFEIEARRSGPCRIMNPWPGRTPRIRDQRNNREVPAVLDRSNGECIAFAAEAGGRYQVAP